MNWIQSIPFVNIGIDEELNRYEQLQIRILNLDVVVAIVSVIIFLTACSIWFFQYSFLVISLLLIPANILILYLNHLKKYQLASLYGLTFYAVFISVMVILFGSYLQTQLVLIVCSFSCFTHYIPNKKAASTLFILVLILFSILVSIEFDPIFEFAPVWQTVTRYFYIVIFAFTFAYKMLIFMAYQKVKLTEEVEFKENERQKDLMRERLDILQLIINNLPQYIFWKDDQGRFLGGNSMFLDYLELNDASELADKHTDIFKEKLKNTVFQINLPENEAVAGYEIPYDCGQREAWFRITRTDLRRANGKYFASLYSYEDITKQIKDQEEKYKAEKKFERLFSNSPFGIGFRCMDEPNISSFNPKLREILRIPNDVNELPADAIMIHPKTKENQEKMEELRKGRLHSYVEDTQFKRLDGEIFWGRIYRSIINLDGKDYVIGFVVDVDEQKKAQFALVNSESKYRSLFENGFDGIVNFDLEQSRIVEVNQKLLEYFKLESKEDFLSRDSLAFSPEYQPDGIRSEDYLQTIMARANQEDGFEFNWLHQLDDGTKLYTSVYTFKNSDNPNIYTSIFRDITQNKLQEMTIEQNMQELNAKNKELEKYIESNMQLENFAYIASHDLKGPIRTMVSFSQLLKRSAKDKLNQDEVEYLNFILSATKNMQMLIDDLLSYSRVDTKKIQRSLFSPQSMIEDICYELSSQINEHGTNVEIGILPDKIEADKTKVKQLFQNLISNAVKFSAVSEFPKVEIHAKEKDNAWQFIIRDNGIGIEEEYFQKIFLLFKKLHTNDVYEGTGIGLALCKKIVEQHQGKIWLESTLGEGTTFYFTLMKT